MVPGTACTVPCVNKNASPWDTGLLSKGLSVTWANPSPGPGLGVTTVRRVLSMIFRSVPR